MHISHRLAMVCSRGMLEANIESVVLISHGILRIEAQSLWIRVHLSSDMHKAQ